MAGFSLSASAFAVESAPAPAAAAAAPAPTGDTGVPGVGPMYIKEYRVKGSHLLNAGEVGDTVYPFLGPGRSEADVEQARAALEKAYRDKGFQTVSVQIPQQKVRGGVVMLEVVEAPVGRLRVHGSRYYSLSEIKKHAPSLAEGTVPNFNDITRDIVSLNQWNDRRITPALKPGVEPNTVDIDLNVKDTLPLHGSMELNNRYSPNTTELRLNGSFSYQNLWQQGHALGFSFQLAPQRLEDAKVYSGYYLARFPGIDWLTLIVQGTKQDSNVSTLGGAAVAGRGEVLGARLMMTLPQLPNYYHTLTFGLDYKHFVQGLDLGTGNVDSPVTYYPWDLSYSGTLTGKGYHTDVNLGLTFSVRGLGSDAAEFDANRFNADGSFVYLRGDIEHTIELPKGFQVSAKVQGQIADQPLVSSEQFSAGGLSSVRGYLESEAPGDNAILGSLEFRTPSFSSWFGDKTGEWRLYAFFEGGRVTINTPLPDQQSRFDLASYGAGSRMRLGDHLNGSIDAAVPLIDQQETRANEVRVTFRVWADF